ncbi:MAG: hypothetical protein Q8M01_20780 [Rubrivivax sp.]|nr:hypothetical protein [Rubrivivax sp.]
MDLLSTAVVDITTLVSACHALLSEPVADDLAMKPKLRKRLRREIKRGTVAYIDTLARARRGVVDAALLAACRVAAEQHMARALGHQELLSRVLFSQPGALKGVAAARQDLWRLAHMAIYLRLGVAALRDSGAWADVEPEMKAAASLRRRLRKALIAYARATLRVGGAEAGAIGVAREAAWAEIGKRGATDAQRLSDIEAGGDPMHTVIQVGVRKPLRDLALDWRSH